MIALIKKYNRWNMTLILGIMSMICFSLSAFRINFTGTTTYIFLIWNLFLAFLPWLFSSLLILYPSWRKNKVAIVFMLLAWLLFFPNALYIITDLFHLHKGTAMPMWFDLVLVLTFAWTGLIFGFISLFDIEKILEPFFSKKIIVSFSILLLFAGSFGVYLGRFLRWNSWDIIHDPIILFSDILNRFMHPFSHPRTWGVTLFVGIMLSMMYFSLKLFKVENNHLLNELKN
jgi:uncharacterized membrane protein